MPRAGGVSPTLCVDPAAPAPLLSLRSHDACRLAVAAYDHVFRQCGEFEPDVGFAERYVSGRRSLDARASATPWTLPDERVEAVEQLLDEVSRARADAADEWVDRFPVAFLALLERRRTPWGGSAQDGRRFGERAPTDVPHRTTH